MSGHCNACGSLKIQETCYLCGSQRKRDPSTLEDGSDDGSGDGLPQPKKRETESVQDYRVREISIVPVPPPAFYGGLCRTCSDFVNCPGLELSKPSSSSQHFPQSPQAVGVNPSMSPLSPSTSNGGSTPVRRCLSDLLPVASPPGTGAISLGQGELLKPSTSQNHPNVSPLSVPPAKAGYAEPPPLPPLRRCISDVLPLASPTRTGLVSYSHGNMSTGPPVITRGSPDHERFKRMIDGIKKVKQLCETVVLEAEGAGSHHNNATEGSNADTEEEVSIERDGEYVRVYMKCACCRAYQFLYSESHCYYRLM